MHWHLDIYAGDAVPSAPPESVSAAWLADRLRTVVAYEAMPFPPSAYWLVGPDGRRTRARIYEEETGDAPGYRIDAVEHPLAALPGLRVAALPEVIRSYRMPTPITDRLRAALQPWLVRHEGTSAGKAAREATTQLGAWESMVTRLTEGWPPDGWYPVEYYREDLTIRDELTAAADALPEPARHEVTQALTEIDRRFAEATEDDGGQALAARTGPLPIDRPGANRWWWRHVPHPLPWQDTPGEPRRTRDSDGSAAGPYAAPH